MESKLIYQQPYILSKFLGVAPIAKEDKVAVVVHAITGSDHTIHGQWKFEAAFHLCKLDREDLHGRFYASAAWDAPRCQVCKLHGTHCRCTQVNRLSEI